MYYGYYIKEKRFMVKIQTYQNMLNPIFDE